MNCKRLIAAAMVVLLTAGLAGCAGGKRTQKKETEKEVKIPMILTVDPSTGNKNEEEVVRRFNRAYKGKYYIDVDWVMETEEEYRKNLKRLNVTDDLPAVITDLRMLPSFYQMMVKEGRIEDLTSYINNDKEWKEMIEPTVLESVCEEDGKVYLGPISTAAFACSGVFWNQELFEKRESQNFQRHGMSSGHVVISCRQQVLHRWHCIQKERHGHRCFWQQPRSQTVKKVRHS